MSLKKIHFLNTLLEKNEIPHSYKSLSYTFNGKLFYNANNLHFIDKKNNELVTSYIAFPNFLTPVFNNTEAYKAKKNIQRNQKCFGIIITEEIKSINQYLNAHFRKNSRSPIIRKMKRLESCFNITYKVFYGDIKKEYYSYLMKTARAMLVRRFEQRNDKNFILKNWQKYYNILFALINEKKASIFVIYNEKEPIQISINFHNGKTFFAYIPAYNIDYAQFGLGNTAVYKQLEWCIENKYEYLDMGNGDLDYKIRWCNYHYDLETHVYYKKNSILAWCVAIKEITKIKITNILKEIQNRKFYKKGKNKLFPDKTNNTIKSALKYSIENTTNTNNVNNFQEINLKANSEFECIKKPLFDFLYASKMHFNQVKIYKIKSDVFLLKGLKKSIKVSFN